MSQSELPDSPDEISESYYEQDIPEKENRYGFLINILLFLFTFFSTTIAGVFWANKDPYQLNNFSYGLTYSFLILLVISTHEFGHYFAAKYHKVPVTLPYYIPFPFLFLNPFGTMGAVIRMKARYYSRKALLDIGAAGPIAGWVTSVIILIIGFTNLPSIDYLYNLHPDYRTSGIPLTGFTFGYNILFWTFEKIFASSPNVFMPPMNEFYHYPFLCVGWFGLLITSLNMLPVGQLDGGHISYAMFGNKHKFVAYVVFALLIIFGLLGLLPLIGINNNIGSLNWLVWAILIFFVIKIRHPQTYSETEAPLGPGRMLTGWFTYFIFIVSFCPVPVFEV
ncbi:MAG TPA: site-2 protease family protein [Ignavibacteria bacterium]|nr:site-2 protease family protein [Ignavibacteria bacterium]